jgi:hypothetical protein
MSSTDDPVIAKWAASGSRARHIAATLARELMLKPPNTQVESSMKIAARFGTNNTMAVRARYLLKEHGIIRKVGRHYYVALREFSARTDNSGRLRSG